MKKFHYKARTQQGKLLKGIVEAVDKKAAVRALQGQKLVVVGLGKAGESVAQKLAAFFAHPSSKELTRLTRQLATMINAGLSLIDGLKILEEQSSPAMSKVLAEVLKDVQGGSSLYQAMSRHKKVFSQTYLVLVKTGEMAGVLDEVLKRMAGNLEKQEVFKAKVKGAMIYPVIVIGGMILVAAIMMIFVIPKLMEMYEEFGAQLPGPTRALMAISSFTVRFWIFGFIGLVGLGYAAFMWKKTPTGREQFDKFFLKIPIIGVLLQKVILAEITRTLSLLTHAGVSIIDSLNIVAEGANNALFEKAFKKAAKDVEKGLPLGESIAGYEFIPPVVTHMVSVGEQTGRIDEILGRVSLYFQQEAELAIKALTTAIEPLMIVILGIGVGFLVIAIIIPIYNLTAQF